MKITVADARPEVGEAVNLCQGDARVLDYINRAIRRLFPKGDWVGTTQRYAICTNKGCLTWPREITAIREVAVCKTAWVVRSGWWEFLPGGEGLQVQSACAGNNLIDRDRVCSFNDITAGAIDRKIQVVSAVAESASAVITLQGYDENGQWIRTVVGGVYIEGEQVAISTTPTLSVNKFTRLTRVIKPITVGPVRLYEYSVNTSTVIQQLAYYEYDEKIPDYRRSFVPLLSSIAAACQNSCATTQVVVMSKLGFIAAIRDTDILQIGNTQAIVEMARGLRAYQEGNQALGFSQERLATFLLNQELRDENPPDTVPATIRQQGTASFLRVNLAMQ